MNVFSRHAMLPDSTVYGSYSLLVYKGDEKSIDSFLDILRLHVSVFEMAYKKTRGPRATARSTEWSDIARYANIMQHFFPILSSQLMKRSSFEQFLILKKNIIWA